MALSTKDLDKKPDPKKKGADEPYGTTEGVKPPGESFEQVLVKKHEDKDKHKEDDE